MAKIENSVSLFGPIAPNDTADTYATHFEDYGQGGFRTVATIAIRDGIPTERRKEGMEVKVLADGKKYELVGGTANANWQEVVTVGEVDPALVEAKVNAVVPTAVETAMSNSETLNATIDAALPNAIEKTPLGGIKKSQLNLYNPATMLIKDVAFTGFSETGYIPTSSIGGYLVDFPAEKGATYTIVSSGDSDRFRLAANIGPYVIDVKTTRFLADRYNVEQMTTPYTVTLEGDEDHILISVSTSGSSKPPTWVQIEKGDTYSGYVSPTAVTIEFEPESVPKKAIAKLEPFFITDDVKGNYYSDAADYIDPSALTLNDFYGLYDTLCTAHPDYVTRTLIGNEATELPIYRYDFIPQSIEADTITQPKTAHPKIIYGSIHGHEKRAALGGYQFFKSICDNWADDDILRMLRWNIHFIVVPCWNPYSFSNNQRKNSNDVDLNRNFPSGWTLDADPLADDYGGAEPLSELETQYIDTFIQDNLDAVAYFDHHNLSSFATDPRGLWLGSYSERIRKILKGVVQQCCVNLREMFPTQTAAIETPLGSLRVPTKGSHTYHAGVLGMPAVIIETTSDIGTAQDLQKYTTNVVAASILAAIRYKFI